MRAHHRRPARSHAEEQQRPNSTDSSAGVGASKQRGLDTHNRGQRKDNPIVFLDVSIEGKPAGRFTIELRADVAPTAAENFRLLVTGERGSTADHTPLHYKGSCFHRIVKDQGLYGGDLQSSDGSGRVTAFGAPCFKDENFMLRHVGPGVISCVNTGIDSNNSQFMIPTVDAPYLDGLQVVFGVLVGQQSHDLLAAIEATGSDEHGTPTAAVVITDCGQLYPVIKFKAGRGSTTATH